MEILKRKIRTRCVLFLLILVVAAGAAWGDDFIPDKGEGFFPGEDEGFFRKRPPVEPPGPGEDEGATEEKPKKRYTWCFNFEADTVWSPVVWSPVYGGINPVFGLGAEWSPVPHIGVGLDIGIMPFRPSISLYGPGDDAGWEDAKEYITIADNADQDQYYQVYYFMLGADFPVTSFEVSGSYYISDRGLFGFYGGLGAGLLVNWAGPEFFLHYEEEWPIESIDGDTPDLPAFYDPVVFKVTPHIGYKLVLWGVTLDVQLGYTFATWDFFSGLNWTLSIGYALGEK